MGIKPPLPAPTESSTLQTSGGSVIGTDLATDLSRRTDRTSVSIPEDGSPVTISTKKKRDKRDRDHEGKLTKGSHQSQTSLLIEYFEGGKGPNVHARPSVRVKVTPSGARKVKDTHEHIQITEAGGTRKPSYTRRISLGSKTVGERQTIESADDKSISSYTSAAEDSGFAGRYPPVEIEVMHRDQESDMSTVSATDQARYVHQNPSEISSMPPDSMLEADTGNLTPRHNRSRSLNKGAAVTVNDTLKTPSRTRSRSLSRERLAQKVVEKLGNKPRETSSGKRRHGSKARSRSVSNEQIAETIRSPKRQSSGHHHDEETASGVDSSVNTNSQLSSRRKSGDQYSFRSGTSKSSVNNPKLLETVEDVIRRLILPELTTLKQAQKMQQNRTTFDQANRDFYPSGSNQPHDIARRVSKHASAPNVSTNPKVVLNQDENHAGIVLSGDSVKGRKGSNPDQVIDSPYDRSFDRGLSEETVIHSEGKEPRRKGKDGYRPGGAAVGALAGAVLTSAALKHHDSQSSVEKQERKRRRNKSHSRTTSVAGSTEEIFSKHDVPPMPMRSEIYGSEVTRDSILSQRTEEPLSPSERRRTEIREISRGSPREVLSPTVRTPTRTPVNLRKGLGTYHSNLSRSDLSVHSAHSNGSPQQEDRRSMATDIEYIGDNGDEAHGATNDLSATEPDLDSHDQRAYALRAHNRGLSPIQSVASFQEEGHLPNRDSLQRTHSSGSLSSLNQRHGKVSGLSINSLSSAASTKIARSNRPKAISLENGQEILDQHVFPDSELDKAERSPGNRGTDDWYESQHKENDRYRDSYGDDFLKDPTVDYKHLTNFTDDSMDAPHLDKVAAARQIQGLGANPEYVRTPVAVESAVASLLDPSIVSERSRVENKSFADSLEDYRSRHSPERDEFRKDGTEHDNQNSSERFDHLHQRSAADSPRHSVTPSLEDPEEHIPIGASALPVLHDPMPEFADGLESESDLITNPSIINGPPIGGVHHDSRDHWPYQAILPQSTGEHISQSNGPSAHASLKAGATGVLNNAASAKQDNGYRESQNRSRGLPSNSDNDQAGVQKNVPSVNHDLGPIHDTYMSSHHMPGSPGGKDEGYISAPPAGGLSPDSKPMNRGLYSSSDPNDVNNLMGDNDPFVGDSRRMSANSHGLPSPLYDSATGGGIDRIQSKDIIALMDHLTVRDAQRNARDTEILVTLVRSAAEMRNSFEDMKRFIASQDDMLVDTGNKQHDRTIQKVIGGPRPQPFGAPRAARRPSGEDDYMEDLPTKRRNVFRRALKGLSGRNSNDLSKIEEMLVQLLGNVEGLKAAQDIAPRSLNSYDNQGVAGQDGYEPEGQAGTSSTGNHSGYFSNPPSRQASGMKSNEARKGSQNRISTVLEGDEELEDHERNLLENDFDKGEKFLTPTRDFPRGGSVPLETPTQVHIPTGALSNENTPKTGTDRSRKHKSSSSSFFPKISRWSKTTASSPGGPGRRERPLSEVSRSGSEANLNDDHYELHEDDRLRSSGSLDMDAVGLENRPPSPLVPSQVSEKPKYQAQRDSLNLQHPQPRHTHRHYHQLESQAHNFGSPISPKSDQWGSNPSLVRFAPTGSGNRHSGGAGNLSPISDAGYSDISAADQTAISPRPPKIKDDGPLIPSRSSRLSTKENKPSYASSPLSSEHLAPEQRYTNGSASYERVNDSPRSASGSVPKRKPTGPRPITTSGSFSPAKGNNGIKQHQYRGSPNHIASSKEDVAQ